MATASSTETEKLAPLDARRPGSFTMYRSERKLDLEQIAFAAECILLGALDMIEGGLPTSIDWADRQQWANRIVEEPLELSPYERGALEAAGEALSILYAQLTGDGICCYEALEHLADGFDAAVERMMRDPGTIKDKPSSRRSTASGRSTCNSALRTSCLVIPTAVGTPWRLPASFCREVIHAERLRPELFRGRNSQ
jgi:hypothetical protein